MARFRLLWFLPLLLLVPQAGPLGRVNLKVFVKNAWNIRELWDLMGKVGAKIIFFLRFFSRYAGAKLCKPETTNEPGWGEGWRVFIGMFQGSDFNWFSVRAQGIADSDRLIKFRFWAAMTVMRVAILVIVLQHAAAAANQTNQTKSSTSSACPGLKFHSVQIVNEAPKIVGFAPSTTFAYQTVQLFTASGGAMRSVTTCVVNGQGVLCPLLGNIQTSPFDD